MSLMNTPALNPVPTALEKASLAAKRLASVPALVKGRRSALARSISVKTRFSKRAPKRSSEAWIRSILQRSEPMPMIMTASGGHPSEGWGLVPQGRPQQRRDPSFRWGDGERWSPRRDHRGAHPADALDQTDEHRLADQEMADIQLPHLRDRGDGGDIVIGQAVAGMDLYPVLRGECGGIGEAAQLGGPGLALEFGITPGMELDYRSAEPERRFDLAWIGLDEPPHADVCSAQVAEEILG